MNCRVDSVIASKKWNKNPKYLRFRECGHKSNVTVIFTCFFVKWLSSKGFSPFYTTIHNGFCQPWMAWLFAVYVGSRQFHSIHWDSDTRSQSELHTHSLLCTAKVFAKVSRDSNRLKRNSHISGTCHLNGIIRKIGEQNSFSYAKI